jgi:hypothetical protein
VPPDTDPSPAEQRKAAARQVRNNQANAAAHLGHLADATELVNEIGTSDTAGRDVQLAGVHAQLAALYLDRWRYGGPEVAR